MNYYSPIIRDPERLRRRLVIMRDWRLIPFLKKRLEDLEKECQVVCTSCTICHKALDFNKEKIFVIKDFGNKPLCEACVEKVQKQYHEYNEKRIRGDRVDI